MADLKMNIANCASSLAEAQAQYNSAEGRHQASERDLTDARNKLNEAQKTLDAAMAELKNNAPRNTDWYSQRNQPQRVCG